VKERRSPNGTDRFVTVVVPTFNSARTIEACLRSLRLQTVPCTVVVVDNYSNDDTVSRSEPLADVILLGGPERSAQRNQGAWAAPAPVVGFIDSDMVVSPDVVRQAMEAIHNGAGAVIVPERTIGQGFWARVRAFERSFYQGDDDVEAARFYREDIFLGTDGFDETMTGPEDWDLTIRARALAPISRITAEIEHDEGRVRYLDACRRKARYAQGLRRFADKHGPRIGSRILRRPWMRQPTRLVSPLGVGLIALKAGEALAVMGSLLRRAPQPQPPPAPSPTGVIGAGGSPR
jgi:glycosyltransferase involved in cell wall biosynthesis